jgi:hypothetical protein
MSMCITLVMKLSYDLVAVYVAIELQIDLRP